MSLFDSFPHSGRTLVGRPANRTGACRSGYGLALQQRTGQTGCAYCHVSLVDDYHHWLLVSVDHVVPRAEAQRLGIPALFYEDAVNLVLCCSGCNGFGNRYRCSVPPKAEWTLADFLTLRDQVFADRSRRVAERRNAEMRLFRSRPWEEPVSES